MAEKKEKVENKAVDESNPQMEAKREAKKSRWTLELCKKYARRFSSLDAWKIGTPSCFKAAQARGWIEECLRVMPKAAVPIPSKRQKAPVRTKKAS